MTQVYVEIDFGVARNIIEKSGPPGSSQPQSKGLLPFGSRNYW